MSTLRASTRSLTSAGRDVLPGDVAHRRKIHHRATQVRVGLRECDRETTRAAAHVQQPGDAREVPVTRDARGGRQRVALHERGDAARALHIELAAFPGFHRRLRGGPSPARFFEGEGLGHTEVIDVELADDEMCRGAVGGHDEDGMVEQRNSKHPPPYCSSREKKMRMSKFEHASSGREMVSAVTIK